MRASSLDDIQRGDHIFLDSTVYFHHAIVTTVDKLNGEVNIIEYSNTATQFIKDNSCQPKNPGKAEVVKGKIKFDTNNHVYVIKHPVARCFDPETVVFNAERELGKREYNVVTNNCEHFALWCKTGISSSYQANKVTDAFKVAATVLFNEVAGEEIVKTVVSCEVTEKIVVSTIYRIGEGLMAMPCTVTIRSLSKQVTDKFGQKAFETEPVIDFVFGTTLKLGEGATKNGMTAVTKQATFLQAASNSGKEAVKKFQPIFTENVTTTGQGVVKTAVRSKTKEYVSNMGIKSGDSVFNVTTRKTVTKKVVTETTSQESIAAGVKCAMVLEGASALYDIYCAYKNKQEGKISQEEFPKAVVNRVVTGTMNVAGSTVGAAIGQVVIPIPWVGGLVGGFVGSSVGKYIGGLPFSR